MIEWPFGLVRQLLYDNKLSSCCAPTYVLPFKVTTRYIALGGVTSTKLDTFPPHFYQFEAKTVQNKFSKSLKTSNKLYESHNTYL